MFFEQFRRRGEDSDVVAVDNRPVEVVQTAQRVGHLFVAALGAHDHVVHARVACRNRHIYARFNEWRRFPRKLGCERQVSEARIGAQVVVDGRDVAPLRASISRKNAVREPVPGFFCNSPRGRSLLLALAMSCSLGAREVVEECT